MILVGLTGGIASGKSMVAQRFKSLGSYLIDADELGHQAIAPGTEAWKAIKTTFGPEVIHPNQMVDRQKLGAIIFRDPTKRERLNAIVHPEISKEQDRLTREIVQGDPQAVILYDAALLIETGAYQRMDKIIVISANPETQVKRMMERDHLSREESRLRIEAQASNDEKKKYADYLIDGSKPLEVIERRAEEIFNVLKALA